MSQSEQNLRSSTLHTDEEAHVSEFSGKCNETWEEAYTRFETPQQEIRKFAERLLRLGAQDWHPESQILEMFCGRGNGLTALYQMGFKNVQGADISAALLAQYDGPAHCYECDCRELPLPDSCQDIVIVQGGLHHLPLLPEDLQRTLNEVRRILRPRGRIVVVEPWLTPFLRLVHAVCQNPVARRVSPKIDALATMIHHERKTYEQWLWQPRQILTIFNELFEKDVSVCSFGKFMYVGRKK